MSIAAYAAKHFFNNDKVLDKLSKEQRKALIRSGAYTRKVAQRLIRKPRIGVPDFIKKRHARAVKRAEKRGEVVNFPEPSRRPLPAKPGTPPRDKTGTLRRTIFFGVSNTGDSVTVGAIPFATNTVRLLEHGGEAKLKGYRQRPMAMKFAGNPFMGPALKKASPKVGEMFKNIL